MNTLTSFSPSNQCCVEGDSADMWAPTLLGLKIVIKHKKMGFHARSPRKIIVLKLRGNSEFISETFRKIIDRTNMEKLIISWTTHT